MASKSSTIAPRLDALRLSHIEDGDASSLEAHENYDGQRFTGADVDNQDLSGASFSECEFVELSANETDLRSVGFVDTRFDRLTAPILRAPRSRLRDVSVEGSRIGSAEFYESTWNAVRFEHCRLGYVNLRGAELQDVLFVDCMIDELDLGSAKANRVSFENTQVNTLDLTRATLKNVDLRALDLRHLVGFEGLKGATITSYQIAELAPILAGLLGINIED